MVGQSFVTCISQDSEHLFEAIAPGWPHNPELGNKARIAIIIQSA